MNRVIEFKDFHLEVVPNDVGDPGVCCEKCFFDTRHLSECRDIFHLNKDLGSCRCVGSNVSELGHHFKELK